MSIKPHWRAWSESSVSCEQSYNDHGGIASTDVRKNFDTCYQGVGALAGIKGKL